MTVDHRSRVDAPADETPVDHDPDRRWHLEDERAFLQRSLEDADHELEAGDLSAEDHAVLVARDTARLAEVETQLAAFEPDDAVEAPADESALSTSARRPLSGWRRAGIAASCLLIALGIGILVVHFVQARQPGQASSGSITLSQAQLIEQQLQQALVANNHGQTKQALIIYDKVLAEDPSNPVALSDAGWLQWNVGTSARVSSLQRVGRAEIERVVRIAPTYAQGHLYDGLILENQDHNHAAAATQFDEFLAAGPPPAELQQVAALVAPAYQGAGRPVPSDFSATATTTSAP